MVDQNSINRKNLITTAHQASLPVLADLAEMGIKLESLAELINKPIDYEVAIPLLIRWLQKTSDPGVKETLVRALTVKWAKSIAARPLIEEFRKTPGDEELGLKWAIANALSEVADESVFNDLVELVRDKKHGQAREMLAVALGNLKDSRNVGILVQLLDDDQLTGHAMLALRKLAPPEARLAVERYINHPKLWVRNEARSTLKKN